MFYLLDLIGYQSTKLVLYLALIDLTEQSRISQYTGLNSFDIGTDFQQSQGCARAARTRDITIPNRACK